MDYVKDTIAANYELYNYLKTNQKDDIFEYTDMRGAGGDVSTQIDLIAEEIFVKHLGGYGKIISEESGEIGQGDIEIVIDPIDGSNNLMANIPYYGSSVAFKKDGKVFASVICNLANGDLFVKEKTPVRANLNKLYFKELTPSNQSHIGIFERSYTSPEIVTKLYSQKIKFRSLGAMAISLSWAYNLDFVIGTGKIREYDVAAGLHICSGLNIYQGDELLVVSKDKVVFDKMVNLLI